MLPVITAGTGNN